MKMISAQRRHAIVPKARQRHHSYEESLHELAKLIADKPTDVAKEAPAEENEPVERIEANNTAGPPAFDE